MTPIIDNLISNYRYKVKKTNMKCPICNSDLYYVNRGMIVMDGNSIFQCENETTHKFWRNSRDSYDILHLNKNASETNFKSEKDYKFVENNWVEFNESEE